MSKTTTKAPADPICVEILETKPNKMFSEEQRAWVWFLRYSRAVPCAECGKKRKVQWTMLFEFQCMKLESFASEMSANRHMPLTPVCGDHPIGPAVHGE